MVDGIDRYIVSEMNGNDPDSSERCKNSHMCNQYEALK